MTKDAYLCSSLDREQFAQVVGMNEFRFKLSFRVWHPKMHADEIAKRMNLRPRTMQSSGEPRTSPVGRRIGGVNTSTFCVFPLAQGRGTHLIASLEEANRHLKSRKAHLAVLRRSGGRFEYFVGVFLRGNSGFVITPDIAKALGSLQVAISLDIYPPDTK